MKVALFANNKVGWEAAEFLARRDDTEVVALIIHPDKRARYRREIITALPHVKRIYEATEPVEWIDADIGLSVYFGYILHEPLLSMFPCGIINLHPGLLPFNRGEHPAVWSIIEHTPCGTTLHYIDEGIDTGDVIVQKPVNVQPFDTGESLYRKLEYASIDLLREAWPLIVAGNAPRKKQEVGGSFHKRSDLAKIRVIDLKAEQPIGKTIDLLRALSFPNYGVRFFKDGYAITIRLNIEWADGAE